MSRNDEIEEVVKKNFVTSREGRVSRNRLSLGPSEDEVGHVPRGTCE